MQTYRSNGKILLTGEYAVLDGAKALALPCRKGQTLEVQVGDSGILEWKSLDNNSVSWFEGQFRINNGEFQPLLSQEQEKDPEAKNTAHRLQKILKTAFQMNSGKFLDSDGFKVTTRLEFNRRWGLGTSSTLINNISDWLAVDPYKLLKESFGGSGYDIAAARHNHPLTYQITPHGPEAFISDFNPAFQDKLFFVYLNKKQNSREAIAHYRNQPQDDISTLTEKISGITEQIIKSEYLEEFKMLLEAHETLISQAINLPKIKLEMFPDFPGLVKSLGGWGGDFILATGNEEEKEYFRKKGFEIIFEYRDLIL